MLTFIIVMSPFTLLGLICVSWIIKEEWESRQCRKAHQKDMEAKRKSEEKSELVKRFQKLAGITPPKRYNLQQYL